METIQVVASDTTLLEDFANEFASRYSGIDLQVRESSNKSTGRYIVMNILGLKFTIQDNDFSDIPNVKFFINIEGAKLVTEAQFVKSAAENMCNRMTSDGYKVYLDITKDIVNPLLIEYSMEPNGVIDTKIISW
jgi:hypothetical protein